MSSLPISSSSKPPWEIQEGYKKIGGLLFSGALMVWGANELAKGNIFWGTVSTSSALSGMVYSLKEKPTFEVSTYLKKSLQGAATGAAGGTLKVIVNKVWEESIVEKAFKSFTK